MIKARHVRQRAVAAWRRSLNDVLWVTRKMAMHASRDVEHAAEDMGEQKDEDTRE